MAKKNRKPQSPPQAQIKPAGPSQPTLNELVAEQESALVENQTVASEIPEEFTQLPSEVPSSAAADNPPSSNIPPETKSTAASPADLVKLQKAWEKAIEEAKRNNERAKNWSARANVMEESWNKKRRTLRKLRVT